MMILEYKISFIFGFDEVHVATIFFLDDHVRLDLGLFFEGEVFMDNFHVILIGED